MYLDHASEKCSLKYDSNSLLYVFKAMDLFDLGRAQQLVTAGRRAETHKRILAEGPSGPSLTPQQLRSENPSTNSKCQSSQFQSQSQTQQPPTDLIQGLSLLKSHPILVMSVASDILFPAWQQQKIIEALMTAERLQVKHVELSEDVSVMPQRYSPGGIAIYRVRAQVIVVAITVV
ncbi:hypothetical protein AJ78_00486 [Emergomyces pasteurianus Ep9510]|uniref:Uncharacterized protein n=1 Tax=Emergomyces pasteurianus Ep9510 TaxID=1447872 RepID=A0A1J9QH39_9EURO|nr:hypothetical protein AJ78_00486 [Emergomyces pasteurianus Ep9510]